MRVLLIGNGGREHALAWAMAKSPKLDTLFVAPGNGGTEKVALNVALNISDHSEVLDFVRAERIDLVIIGPEAPLVAGLADDLEAAGIAVFGPSQAAAQLEGSKAFTKELCDEMDIPTAAYAKFDDLEKARSYLYLMGAPIVIKADGLAAGKGVTVALDVEDAEDALEDCFSGAFGEAGTEVVIEECMIGEEASLFAICDGKDFIILPAAQDHKRVFDNDQGPNTGGMGTYAPAPVMDDEVTAETIRTIIKPAIEGMAKRGTPFKGVLFAGLMITEDGPKLIEFNTRFGDPECQVLMMLLKSDILDILKATAKGTLASVTPEFHDEFALTVVMAANGYPGDYAKGTEIFGADDQNTENVHVFHAGTKRDEEHIYANGGRVLNVTARGTTVQEARERAYAAVQKIKWDDGFYRTDIGWRALNR